MQGRKRMRRKGAWPGRRLVAALCLAGGLCAVPASGFAFHQVAFDERDVGDFPSEWKVREKAGRSVYSVQQDGGGLFLHAESVDNAHAIGRALSVDPKAYPYLRFSWRALKLPPGGKEGQKTTNDGALGVYVVFEGWSMPPRSIKYVWSTTLPEGTEETSPYSKKARIVVLRSGSEKLGEWVDEKVNVLEDFRRLFGSEEVPRVRGIGILTDSDNTASRSAGDYRSFRFSREGEKVAAKISP
jgi:hypothetical protein